MARLIKVAEADELAPGQGKLVQVEGRDVALFNVAGTYQAMDAVCPHEGGPLNEGELEGSTIVCPWHGYDFDVGTGTCSIDADLQARIYPVKAVGQDICIEVA